MTLDDAKRILEAHGYLAIKLDPHSELSTGQLPAFGRPGVAISIDDAADVRPSFEAAKAAVRAVRGKGFVLAA